MNTNSPDVRRAVLIIGMHRSGTSAITRVLSLFGYNLPSRLLEFDPSDHRETNASGFWEAADVRAINDRFLERVGLRWHSVAPMPSDAFCSEAAAEARASISTYLSTELEPGSIFLIKDPRISRMMPIWLEALAAADVAPLFLISVRSPTEVARSLNHRNKIRYEYSFLLWLRYYLEAEVMSRGFTRAFVNYDALTNDWRAATGMLLHTLGLPTRQDSIDLENAVDSFLRLSSIPVDEGVTKPDVPDLAKDVYQLLLDASEGRALDTVAMDKLVYDVARADQMHGVFLEAISTSRFNREDESLIVRRSAIMDEFEGRRVTLAGSGVVWFVINGYRRFIPSGEVYSALFDNLDIDELDNLDVIPRGQDLVDGTCLVQTSKENSIYLITSSAPGGVSKHLIIDFETFSDFGLSIAAVRQVPDILMQAVPWGSELRRPALRC